MSNSKEDDSKYDLKNESVERNKKEGSTSKLNEKDVSTDVSEREKMKKGNTPSLESLDLSTVATHKKPPKGAIIRMASMSTFSNEYKRLVVDMNDFDVVLKEPVLCAGFRKYVQQTFCEENLDFWKRVEYFKTVNDDKRKEEGILICSEFLSDSSQKQINVAHTSRIAAETCLMSSNDDIPIDVFDAIQTEIYFLMKRDSFKKFIEHPLFEQTKSVYKKVKRLDLTCSNTIQQLSEREWKKILTGGQEIRFAKGATVLTQGKKIGNIYRLKSGSVDLYRISNDNPEVEILINSFSVPNTLIGEKSILNLKNKSSKTVVCTSDTVLECVPASYVLRLLKEDFELARKFYITIGISLSKTLKDLSSLDSPSLRSSRRSTTMIGKPLLDETPEDEENFYKLFNLPEDHVLIKQCSCSYEKVVVRKGTLYISQSFIFFYAKIFTQKTKERIALINISDITTRSKGKIFSSLKITCGKKKYSFVLKSQDASSIYDLLQDLMSIKKSSGIPNEANDNFENDSESENDEIDHLKMTSADWDIILAGGETAKKNSGSLMTFSPGDAILEEGLQYNMVCQIASGTCKIEKRVPDSDLFVELGQMKSGEVFGEINFLTGKCATASVIADSRVDMYVVGPTIQDIFPNYPDVVVRFYNYLCNSLARRIEQRFDEGWGTNK